MATTTTFNAIRNKIYTNVLALTPVLLTANGQRFEWFRLGHQMPLRQWALENPSACFRKFDMLTISTKVDLGLLDPGTKWSAVDAMLTVAYHKAPTLVSASAVDVAVATDMVILEDMMERDASKIYDAIVAGSNYVAGQQLAEVAIEPPDRSDPLVWFQDLRVTVSFFDEMHV